MHSKSHIEIDSSKNESKKKKENKKNKSVKTLCLSESIQTDKIIKKIEEFFVNRNLDITSSDQQIIISQNKYNIDKKQKQLKIDSQDVKKINTHCVYEDYNFDLNSIKLDTRSDDQLILKNIKEELPSNLKKKRPRKSKRDSSKKIENRNHCNICKERGELLCCDNCPRSFHLNCLKLNKNDIPSHIWFCATCKPIIEKRNKIQKEKEERLKKRQEDSKLNKKKKKLNYKKLKKERLLMEKKIINELNSKLINMIETYIANDSSLDKLPKTDSNSKTEEITENNYEKIDLDETLFSFRELLDFMKTCTYEKTLEFIKFLVDIIFPKIEFTKNKKKKGQRKSVQSSNDNLSSLNTDIGINTMINTIKLNNISALGIFKQNTVFPMLQQELMVQSPAKQNLKYPIHDKLLYDNYEYYDIPKDFFFKPLPKKSIMPPIVFGKIIKIWDFIMTFKEILEISFFSPEELFFCLVFSLKKEIILINEVHISLLNIFADELVQIDYIDLDRDQEIIFLKIALEKTIKNNLFKYSWLEIIRILINSKRYNLLVDKDLEEIAKKIQYIDLAKYNLLSLDEKIKLLDFLINSAYETSTIRKEIKEVIDKKNDFKREKSSLELQLKTHELRKREIDNSEKFLNAKFKIDILNNKIIHIEENSKHSRVEIIRKKKEFDKEREGYKSILKELDDIEASRIKIKNRLDKLKEEINSLSMAKKKLIGMDYHKTEYYYFKEYNNKLIVKIKNEWFYYSTGEEIEDLMSKLSEKGINEKNLLSNINKLLNKNFKAGTTSSTSSENEISQFENEIKKALDWKNEYPSKNKIVNKFEISPIKKIYKTLVSLEQKLSEYLSLHDKEWESLNNREEFIAYLRNCDDLNEFGKAIILLLERFINPYKVKELSNQTNENYKEKNKNFNRIFDKEHKILPYCKDENRIICQKTKFWPKEYENLNLENSFTDYINSKILSTSSLNFALLIFESLITNFLKRREFINKRISHLSKEATELNNSAHSFQPNSKKIIEDFTTEGMKEEEEKHSITNSQKISADLFNYKKNENTKNNHKNYLSPSKQMNKSKSCNKKENQENKAKRKIKEKIEWNDTCYICNDYGDLMCCGKCPNVAHLFCVALEKIPKDWMCEECLNKNEFRRSTRSHKNIFN